MQYLKNIELIILDYCNYVYFFAIYIIIHLYVIGKNI